MYHERTFRTIHEGDKGLKCDICDFKFGHKANLHWHVVTVHDGKKLLKCEGKKTFSNV